MNKIILIIFLAFFVAIPISSALIPFIIPEEGKEGETGSIELFGSPGAMISIDNRSFGTIPSTGTVFIPDIRAGLRSVEVSMEGFEPEFQNIAVFLNETSSVTTSPFIRSGGIEITSIPEGAEIYLNGVRFGNTPIKANKMNVGNYSISMKMIGYYPWDKQVAVNWNDNTVIEAKLISMKPQPTDRVETPGFTVILVIISLLSICWVNNRR